MALVYGPDRGLVQERVKLIREAVFGAEFDPMNHVRFTADEIEADPTRLVDEVLRGLSLMGGPRLVEATGNDDWFARLPCCRPSRTSSRPLYC